MGLIAVLQASPWLAAFAALAFGLLVGSFLNVVILRMPPRLEWQWRRDCRELLELPEVSTEVDPKPPGIVVKGSHCPGCGHTLAPWENIPVLSWLLLRGRCRGCGMRISVQYPVVELLTGLLFAICMWQFGWSWQSAAAIVFTGLLVALSGVDMRTTLLPDQLTLPLLWLGLLLSVVVPGGLFIPPVSAILGAAVGYLSLWSVYWAFKLLTGKEGMGYGDFKLLAALGAWCGVSAVLPIVLISSLVGAVIGSVWLLAKGRDKATPIPFGPYLAIAGWIELVFRPDLLGTYARVAGLN